MNLKKLLIEPTQNGFLQFFRYAFVGGIASIVDWATLYLLTELGLYYLISAVFGFFTGLITNFVLSKILVFKASEAKVGAVMEFIAYGVIGAVGLGLTLIIMYVLTEFVGFFYMLSKITATVLVLMWNYLARKYLLYKNK